MLKKILIIGLFAAAVAHAKDERPLLLAHFMPWHQAPNVSGYWGWHWTMNHFDPNTTDQHGRREIASHYYPLTGPYDSKDPDILEYQTLLMKLSGIDGVLVDWYGMENFWDYGVLNEATNALFEACDKAGLSFAICYEDQTIKHMIDNKHLKAENALDHARQVMQYMESNWFGSDTYQYVDGRPLLLVFGPQYFQKSQEWTEIFSVLTTPPIFFTEDERLSPAVGAYPWPPMWLTSPGNKLTPQSLRNYLTSFYNKAQAWDYTVAGAWAQFHDIYAEAGVSDGYGVIEADDGTTLRSTLQQAIEQSPVAIQLVTWNDYGEGTMLEPTEEFGTLFLEIVQEARRTMDSDFDVNSDWLQVPLQIFQLRKNQPNDVELNKTLDTVFSNIIAGRFAKAADLLSSVGIFVGVNGKRHELPVGFALKQNYPNPFNPATRIAFHLPRSSNVTLRITDITGRARRTIQMGAQSPGQHEILFDATGLESGVYFYALQLDDAISARKKMVVMH